MSFDDVVSIFENDSSILCQMEGEEIWIPKSQITDDSEVWEEGQEGTLVVTEWLANQRGWL